MHVSDECVFYVDVAKVDLNIAMLHMLFHVLQMFYLDVASLERDLNTTPKQNYLGGQKTPRKVPKPPSKRSLAAGQDAAIPYPLPLYL